MQIYTPWFKYKGIDSRQMGIIITSMPPVTRAEQRMETLIIPGRSGSLHIFDGGYANYTKTMECAIRSRQHIDEMAAWLTGSGELILSNEPDKVYRVHIANTLDIEQMMLAFQKFQLHFDTYPFKYSVNAFGEQLTLTKSPQTIFGAGTYPSEPIITIWGTGAVTLTINGQAYAISGISQYLTIDSEIQEVYKGSQNMNNLYLQPDFPLLQAGQTNTISWTGDIDKIDIQPNWRWL